MAEQDPKPQTGRFMRPASDHRPEMVDWAPEDHYAPVEPVPSKLDPRDVRDLAIGAVGLVAFLILGGVIVAAWLGVL